MRAIDAQHCMHAGAGGLLLTSTACVQVQVGCCCAPVHTTLYLHALALAAAVAAAVATAIRPAATPLQQVGRQAKVGHEALLGGGVLGHQPRLPDGKGAAVEDEGEKGLFSQRATSQEGPVREAWEGSGRRGQGVGGSSGSSTGLREEKAREA